MRPLGLNDTLFYNLRDAQVTAALVLDGPCDLATVVAEADGVLAALPGFAETPVRRGLWFYAMPPDNPVDLADHIFITRAPEVRSVADLPPLLDRLRRNRIAVTGPQWRMTILNPAGTPSDTWEPPLSAVLFQFRHGLADGTRAIQMLVGAGGHAATSKHAAIAQLLREIDLKTLPQNIAVTDTGPLLMDIPRSEIARAAGGASRALAEVVRETVSDPDLYPGGQPLRGNIGATRLVLRRGAEKGVGNHLKMETLEAPGGQAKRRWRIPGLAHAQELPISQWAIALSPSPLARKMMHIWYSSFDGIATLIPMPAGAPLGGQIVTAIYGVPPIWRSIPLLLLVCADAGAYHAALYPGSGFSGDADRLLARVRELLTRGKPPPAALPGA